MPLNSPTCIYRQPRVLLRVSGSGRSNLHRNTPYDPKTPLSSPRSGSTQATQDPSRDVLEDECSSPCRGASRGADESSARQVGQRPHVTTMPEQRDLDRLLVAVVKMPQRRSCCAA